MRRAALALAGAALLCGCGDDALVAACEKTLLARLASPSGYKRIEAAPAAIDRQLTVVEAEHVWLDGRAPAEHWDELNARRAAMAKGDFTPVRWRARLVYDAPNRFGAPVRGLAWCEWDDVDGEGLGALQAFAVRVDGLTGLEFTRKALER